MKFLLTILSPLIAKKEGNDPIGSDDIINKLFPEPWDALAIFLAFVVLVVVVFFLVYKPVKKAMKQRGDYVEGKIKNAEQDERIASENRLKSEQNILSAKKEAGDLIKKAKDDALKEREKVVLETEAILAEKRVETKKDIEREIEKSKDEVRKQIVDVAFVAAEKVLGREVTDSDNSRLIDDFVADINKDKK